MPVKLSATITFVFSPKKLPLWNGSR